jgi:O-antigen ligase
VRLLYMLVIGVLAGSDILNEGMSMGHGLSVKNALLYPIALGLIFRMALTGRLRTRLPIVNVAFLVWFAYALLTWIVCLTVIHYPGYEAIPNAITLKGKLFDSALFFFTFLYGIQTKEDFFVLAKTLACAICVANIMTLADVAGIVHLGITIGSEGVEAGRVFGVFGHANDTAALIVCLLPLLLAVATSSRGWPQAFWYIGALSSVAVLLLTVSRGAFVGVAVGYGAALWLCRRYLPTPRVVGWVLVGLASLAVSAALAVTLMPDFWQVLMERFFNQSMAVSAATASSGRTFLWLRTLHGMMDHPITFVTGYGWRTYELWYVLITHNFYLDQWFNLGLIGLLAFVTILYQTITTARRAVAVAEASLRPYLIAFVFGMLGLAVAVFFVNLERPWDYVWMYVGLTMSAAVDALEKSERPSARPSRTRLQTAAYSPVTPARRAPPRAARGLVGDVRR